MQASVHEPIRVCARSPKCILMQRFPFNSTVQANWAICTELTSKLTCLRAHACDESKENTRELCQTCQAELRSRSIKHRFSPSSFANEHIDQMRAILAPVIVLVLMMTTLNMRDDDAFARNVIVNENAPRGDHDEVAMMMMIFAMMMMMFAMVMITFGMIMMIFAM
eukprot:6173875-Pleurochrysis_carterae.AAC.1